MHLMLCALLACVALLSPLPSADASVEVPHQQALGMQVDVLALTLSATAAEKAAANEALNATTGDLAGDLPELLLVTLMAVAPTTRSNTHVRPPLYALSHPFPERPQRPPRLIIRLA